MKKILSLVMACLIAFLSAGFCFAADEGELPFENSRFFSYEDYTLHYRVYDGDSENQKQMLLIHGFCLSTHSLEGVAEKYMSEGYDVITVDVPNFGYSSRETRKTQLLFREEVIAALLAELSGKWIVGGHSMGGGIAINLATDYPHIVTGLLLFAPQTSNEAQGIMSKLSASYLMQGIYNLVLKIALKSPFLVRLLVEMSFSSKEYAENYDLERITKPLSVKGTGAGITIMASHTKGSDLQKLSHLEIPCVIFTAENDAVASKENLDAIIENSPEGTAVFTTGEGGHMMMEYNPDYILNSSLDIFENSGL